MKELNINSDTISKISVNEDLAVYLLKVIHHTRVSFLFKPQEFQLAIINGTTSIKYSRADFIEKIVNDINHNPNFTSIPNIKYFVELAVNFLSECFIISERRFRLNNTDILNKVITGFITSPPSIHGYKIISLDTEYIFDFK